MALTDKYRPQTFEEMVLPNPHGLGAAVRFIENPTQSRWMLIGKSGLGKTSLAGIMARACADPLCIRNLVGPDLDSNTVRNLASDCLTRPLYGKWFCYVVDEADAIPTGGQVRLLSVLEQESYGIWIFSSNEEVDSWEPRFLSRFTVLQFSNQKLAEPATDWICRIAAKEGFNLPRETGEKIIRASKNNLRAALQRLDALLGEWQTPKMHDFGERASSTLPVITKPTVESTSAPLSLDLVVPVRDHSPKTIRSLK